MPIDYEIYYSVSANEFDPESWDPTSESGGPILQVYLVQTDIVKYPTTRDDYVEEVVVYYTPDTTNPSVYPTAPFILKVLGKSEATGLTMTAPPDRTVLSGDPGTNPAATDTSTNSTFYEWHFTPPGGGDTESTTLFEFDNSSGPGFKVKVKIKKQTVS